MAETAYDYGTPGPYATAVAAGEWLDALRARRILWKRYLPLSDGGTPLADAPVVIYSHGLGGSRESGAGWLQHWASWGIPGVAVQHPGTDAAALAGDSPLALRHLLRTAVDKAQLAARQADLLFALDQVAAVAPDPAGPFGIAGHSYGAVSALRLIGERRGNDDRPADPRLAAAILLSPSARGGSLPLAERFARITLPCLHLTGSGDGGIGPGDIGAADRCLPYRHMPAAQQGLLVLDGAGHPVFAGQGTGSPAQIRTLQAASTAFWLAQFASRYAPADGFARAVPAYLAHADRFEFR